VTGTGYEPGRPNIEEREGTFIWSGTIVLDEHGQDWTVYDTESLGSAGVRLHLKRDVHGETRVTSVPTIPSAAASRQDTCKA
jgi:hypothetical protein